MHRLIGRTGALFAALTLAVAGCATDTEDPTADGANGAPDADPAVVLASSADNLAQEPFRFEMTMGSLLTADGAMDPTAGTASVTMTIVAEGTEMNMEIIATEADMWANLGEIGAMLGAETEWMHMDLTRLGGEGFMGMKPGETDLAGTAEMLEGLGTVERVDDHTFEGVIDVTKGSSGLFDEEMISSLGEEATTLDFTATVDDQERLTHMEIALPPMPDLPEDADSIEIRYFDFGEPVEVTPPSEDEVSEMPAEFYEMFTG